MSHPKRFTLNPVHPLPGPNTRCISSPHELRGRCDGLDRVFKHDRLGTGIVEPGPAAEALRAIGYDGMTVLEIITDATKPGVDPDGDIKASHDILAAHGWAARA